LQKHFKFKHGYLLIFTFCLDTKSKQKSQENLMLQPTANRTLAKFSCRRASNFSRVTSVSLICCEYPIRGYLTQKVINPDESGEATTHRQRHARQIFVPAHIQFQQDKIFDNI
jgi:hypothetical protein